MSDEMKKFLELMKKMGVDQVLMFSDTGRISISADPIAILDNIENISVTETEYKILKITARIDKFEFYGWLTHFQYEKYLESKVA